MDNGRDTDQFDDLFEPFELEEGPGAVPETERAPEIVRESPPPPPAASVNCPSCGSSNPAHNRHCEQCGARLGKGPLPVAPPPMVRTTPGGRALSVLAVVVGIVALVTIFFNLRGGGDGAAADATSTTTTSTTFAPDLDELRPTSVDATSEFPGFEAEHLIDDDPESYWNDNSERGLGAALTFKFAQPVQIRDIEVQNLTDNAKFKRNYRIKDYVIKVDDLAIEISGTLKDENDPQTVQIASLSTRTLTLEVRSTYPAQAVGDDPPFSELALQSLRFFGTPSS